MTACQEMDLLRRQFLHLAAGAAALPALSRMSWAQTYPSRPVRLLIGFSAGGGADIVGRLIGQWLQERLGQPVVIENRPGAGTNVATEALVRAPADGYTLGLIGLPNAINATLYDKLSFNFIRDVTPVAGILSHDDNSATWDQGSKTSQNPEPDSRNRSCGASDLPSLLPGWFREPDRQDSRRP